MTLDVKDEVSGLDRAIFYARYDDQWHHLGADAEPDDGFSISWDAASVGEQAVAREARDPGQQTGLRANAALGRIGALLERAVVRRDRERGLELRAKRKSSCARRSAATSSRGETRFW